MILIADNIQITNKKIERAMENYDPVPIKKMVKECEAAGAEAIDINSGPLYRDPEKKMAFLVETIQEISDLPVLIDTANPRAIESGLNANKKEAIINGFSLEPAKLEAILPLAKKYETDIIGYLLYPNGHVPPDEPERLNVAVELYQEVMKAGIEEKRLIIDPVLAPVTWNNGSFQAAEVLNVIRNLPDLLGFPVKTIVGLSNLITGGGYREKKLLLERSYLPMLVSSDITMILLNIFHAETVRTARACDSLTRQKVFAWEDLG